VNEQLENDYLLHDFLPPRKGYEALELKLYFSRHHNLAINPKNEDENYMWLQTKDSGDQLVPI
jgi:hypothetical protein